MTRIRPAHIEELDILYGIVKNAIRHMDGQGIPQWDDIYPSKVILKDDIEKQQMHVIEVEGRVAGLIVMNEDQSPEYANAAWCYFGRLLVVHRLTIDPTYQHRSLATCLMDFAEDAAASRGYHAIRLDAFTQNPGALALYERRGYRKAGTVRFRKGDFFCYEKQINPDKRKKGSNQAIQPTVESGG